jgi:hypothetical protein
MLICGITNVKFYSDYDRPFSNYAGSPRCDYNVSPSYGNFALDNMKFQR